MRSFFGPILLIGGAVCAVLFWYELWVAVAGLLGLNTWTGWLLIGGIVLSALGSSLMEEDY